MPEVLKTIGLVFVAAWMVLVGIGVMMLLTSVIVDVLAQLREQREERWRERGKKQHLD